MASLWCTLRSLFQFHYFENEELQSPIRLKHQQLAIKSCHIWATIQVFDVVASVVCSISLLSLNTDVTFWALFSIPLVFGAALAALSSSSRATGSRLNNALALCYCLTLLIHCVQYWRCLAFYRERHWDLHTDDPNAIASTDQVASYMFIILSHVDQQLQLLPLLHIGFCPASLVAILAGPIASFLLSTLIMPLCPASFLIPLATSFHAAVAFIFCRNGSSLRQSLFLLELQKARYTEQMQRTDATVNHILKNAMVEASGLVDMFLELCAPPPPPHLVATFLRGALERLHCGMTWCQRRGALLALMDVDARPTPRPTSLAGLGMALAAARSLTSSFAPVVVELDEMLTDLMLESALSNAFRHGHPADPDVHLSITVDPADPSTSTCVVTFRVTNRSDPKRQPLAADIMRRIMEGGTPSSPSVPFAEGSGLQYCFRAAQLQGMVASLTQEGDTVVFQACLVTRLVSEEAAPASSTPTGCKTGPLPLGLKISVFDDSASARILLKHQLSRDIPDCTVETFGKSAEEVDPFLSHTLQVADIAILDQHLDWPSGSALLGTDLVRLLLHAGFRGLTCIRSANTSEADISRYFGAGAHCVLDKLLDRAQTAATLASNYRQFLATRPEPTSHRPDLLCIPVPQFVEPFGFVSGMQSP